MRTPVWRQHDFALLWLGQTVSEVGSQITVLALPTLAIFTFHSGAAAVGVLVASSRIPFPILGLFAGAAVDRIRKRPVMIVCNLARLLILLAIPLLDTTGQLRLWHLFVAAAGMGIFTVFFDIAYMALVPALVGTEQLLEANSRLEVSFAGSALVGPGLGGILVQAFGAARAVLVDALSFLFSAVTVLLIRRHEEPPPEHEARPFLGEIADGLRHVFRSPVLRSQLLCMSAAGIFAHSYEAPLYIFAYGTLHLSPGLVGALLGSQGIGSIAGSVIAMRVIARIGVGNAIAWADGLAIGLGGLVPLAIFLPWPLLFPLFVVIGLLGTVGNIAQVTLRQSLSPPRLQGRMTSVFRTFFWGAWPLGAALGGVVAAQIGAATTLWTAALLGLLINLTILFTPLGQVRTFGPDGTSADVEA